MRQRVYCFLNLAGFGKVLRNFDNQLGTAFRRAKMPSITRGYTHKSRVISVENS
jgi:hypothetical protein